jgi:hypothetical protein
MTDRTSATTATHQRRAGRIKWLAVTLLIALACIASTYSVFSTRELVEQTHNPTPADLARQEADLKWVELWSVISRVTVVIGLVALGIVVLGGAVALVQWMLKEANTIRPRDGLFPLQRLPTRGGPRWLRWPGSDRPLRIYNPNINPAAVLEIHPDTVRYVGAEQVSASQMQAATQGQFVQAIAAEAPPSRRLPRSEAAWPAHRAHQPSMSAPYPTRSCCSTRRRTSTGYWKPKARFSHRRSNPATNRRSERLEER